MNRTTVRLVASTVLALSCVASYAAIWIKTDAGTYDWNAAANWQSQTPPTSATDALLNDLTYRPTGQQTIEGDGSAKRLDLHNANPGRSRTFTGNITASNLYLRVGTMNVEGTLNLTGTDETCSIVGASVDDYYGGTLDIKNGGTIRADGVHAICVGRRASADNSNASGRIFLRDGGRLILNPSGSTAAMAGLMLGRLDGGRTGTYGASYVQFGGEAVLGRFLTGYEKNTFASLSILDGTLDLPYISTETRFRIGHLGYGVFQILGGGVTVGTNYTDKLPASGNAIYNKRPWAFEVGSGNKESTGLRGAHFYACAGSLYSRLDFTIQGPTWDYEGVAPAYATIDGTACVTSRTIRVGASLNDGLAALNLNGGMVMTDVIYSQANRAGRSIVNANGGKLAFPDSATQVQGLNIDEINIYEGGLEIECDRYVYLGNAATNVILRTPGGYGVDIASFTDIGSSYTVPWIEISGGSGSNACAVALVDYENSITTNAVIACRGEGFAEGDKPVATIRRPYGTKTLTDRIALSLSENKPGKLIKTGGQNLALFAQPEFAGTYEVRQGYLIQTTTAGVASPKVKAVVVGGTDSCTFQAGSGNDTAVEANWNPVNPEATLTLGTEYGPGQLRVPGGADGKPFEQAFASLSVNGAGNVISPANAASGTKLSFGMISCAVGSQLTIPRWDSSFKVYVTGMRSGTCFDNIVFEGTSFSAMIGEDGQLVKAAKGLAIYIR